MERSAQKTIPSKYVSKYNFYKADYPSIREQLQTIDWDNTLKNMSASQSVDKFYEILYEILNNNVPLKRNTQAKYPKWFSPALKSSLKRKLKLWKRWKTYQSLSDYAEYSLLRTRCKLLLADCSRAYILDTELAIPKTIKSFWQYVKSLKKNSSGYPSTMSLGDSSSSDPEQIAEMFGTFFSSVFEPTNTMNQLDLDSLPSNPLADNITTLHLHLHKVEIALKNLDVNKGPGPDGISALFLKNVFSEVAYPLYLIFNKCITEGSFPHRWKIAHVTPIHKSGPKAEIPNYRPISNISTIPKLCESMVHDALYPLVQSHINQQQHGFMKKKSVGTNLLLYSTYLFKALDDGLQVDAIYTDFRKAFDKVDHMLLLEKLSYNGIKGNLLKWFASYIENRFQIITINGYCSEKKLVSSGVVQGSILGPLQYLLFINEINECFHNSSILSFADDLKIFRIVKDENDCTLIQEDLNRFNEFCTQHKLQLAYEKCQQISFTRKRIKTNYTYNIGGVNVNKVSIVRDLGVMFDEKLTFNEHIEHICKKAYQMLGFVLRISKPFKQVSTYITLYQSLIRSQFDFASVVWSPHYAVHSNKLESIQKRFVKALHFRLTHSRGRYADLLALYKLQRLSDRRTLLDAMTLYNVCNNLYDCPALLEHIHYRAPSRPSRSKALFSLDTARTNSGSRAPLRRMCETYNKVLHPVDLFTMSKLKFKNQIRCILDDTQNAKPSK
ncbi:hypothetical protein JYU34_005625 [Plutella xylostella]|uniref:Reverse transcriptase domain-containing protein n=1 Tax=Plutella xylostella TaxID=51655 RepID=A0ABQ7QTP6_PLUXY|nr:hypothetical protein JYU34_005625 [Plutella xylostella]